MSGKFQVKAPGQPDSSPVWSGAAATIRPAGVCGLLNPAPDGTRAADERYRYQHQHELLQCGGVCHLQNTMAVNAREPCLH